MNEIIKQDQQHQEIVQKLVLDGDLSKMNPNQKVEYYNRFCQSLGLNPLTQPFQLLTFQGKQRLYATKDCTEQLRKLHGVSITDIKTDNLNGVFVVTVKAADKKGKTDAATGVVAIEGLKGETLANAIMKAETKAKRRVTLSICGLGILDESETETMRGAVTEDITPTSIETKPTTLPILTTTSKKYDLVVERLRNCTTTVDQVKTYFALTDEMETALKAIEKAAQTTVNEQAPAIQE